MNFQPILALFFALIAVAFAAPQYGHESSGYKSSGHGYESKSYEPATSYQNVNLYPQHGYEHKESSHKY
ncbi:unnamed protein product [Bemisia tabaci]|uniref:Uncharacterized protein n=1 Tax=Bemisia tabaci TaxID=7038 RepID=A0A9P0A5V2_BEMTA|nr:unnamed protein product [Bemisia tabaci]